jgi:hypothetical protein
MNVISEERDEGEASTELVLNCTQLQERPLSVEVIKEEGV